MNAFAFFLAVAFVAGDTIETARYLRPADKQFEVECEFKLTRSARGSAIESVTQRGKTKLTVVARYDRADLLLDAEVRLATGDEKKSAAVTVKAGKATVKRTGQPAQEFDVPKGVIVTSAPDWTDVWMLCQRYDRAKGGKQEFAGLWIHPVEQCQRLTFIIEKTGADTIEHDGKKVMFDRFIIRLRGNSGYAAWADDMGRMIKLVPLPTKADATNWLVLQGFEKSAAKLRPQ